ncbi:MAG: choice-of-anchor J domain-containing protein [Candidatus Cloacimonetes bacterium]|nr:choice-of-anchor J domain-containing protein [Candidatus Cloacimonadota bacterium]
MKKYLFLSVLLLIAILPIFAQHTLIIGFLDSDGNEPTWADLDWTVVRPDYPTQILTPQTSLNTYWATAAETGMGFPMVGFQIEDFNNLGTPWAPGQVVDVHIQKISDGDYLDLSYTLTSGDPDLWDWNLIPIIMTPPVPVPPQPANVIYPADVQVDIPLNLTLAWSLVGSVDGYYLSFGTDNPPTNMISMTDVGVVTTYDMTGLTANTMYYWQIIPFNAQGNAVNCPVWSFTTLSIPPNSAVLVSPVDASIDLSVTPVLRWQSGGNFPDGYKVNFGTDNPPTNMINNLDVNMATEYAITSPLNFDTQYFWQIVPYNVIGDAPNCPVWSFTTRLDGIVTIGTGMNTNTHLPIETGAAYSYTQSIYYPEEFGTAGLISTLSYYYNGAFDLSNSNNWNVYMGLTDVDSFTGNSSWIPISELTMVFSGVIPLQTGAGWIELQLNQDFFYDGVSNLVIAVDENQANNGSPSEEFYCTTTSNTRSIHYFTSVSNINPATPPTATGTSANIPNVRMDMMTLGNFPYVIIDTTDIEFGVQDVNTTSVSEIIEITNLGFADAIIDPMISLSGVDADQFVLTDNNTYPLTVSQFGVATVECSFNPTTEGHKEALITITDNVTREVHQIPLHGYAYLVDGNDTSDMATDVSDIAMDNIEISAIIMPDTDVDWYVFWQTGPAHVEMHTENQFGSTVDLYASFFGPYSNLGLTVSEVTPLAVDDNSFDALNPEIVYDITDSGYYYLKIETSTMDRTERWDTKDYVLHIDRPFTIPPAALPPTGLQADITFQGITLMWDAPVPATRQVMGYNVYRDDVMLNTETVTTLLYRDPLSNLVFDQTYDYYVTALYDVPLAESAPSNTITETFTFIAPPLIAEEFDTYANFATEFGYWTSLDEDGENTQTLDNGVDFTGEGTPMAFMIFNPTATTPSLQNADALSGTKYAACFAATTGMNDDWLISPRIQTSDDAINLSFYARSYTTEFGMEQFEIGISNGSVDPADFTIISGDQPIDVPLSWTHFVQDLSAYSGDEIRIGIHCVSNQTMFMMLDDLMVMNENGALDNEGQPTLPETTMLNGNYPNPFNPETTISFSLKDNANVTIDIFNIKGQQVARIAEGNFAAGTHNILWKGNDSQGRKVSSGIYFYKMHTDNYTKTKKMILMK